MTLLEALAHQSQIPCTIIKSPFATAWLGRQYKWHNGHILTRTKTGKWHRTINIPTTMLETCEVDDNEVL